MKLPVLLFTIIALSTSALQAQHAQDSTKAKKKSFGEKVSEIPDMLIAQPDKGADTLADKLKNDNLVLTVPPIWQEKGLQMGNDLKLQKINDDPLNATFPIPDKKIVNALTITLNTIKKLPDEKKQAVIGQVKKDLGQFYKDAAKTSTGDEVNKQVEAMVTGPEAFTTEEGKSGELYLINDIQSQQSTFTVLLLIPGVKPGTTTFVQFQYLKYNYDNNYPEEVLEWRLFQFPDEQKAYVDFTKNILKTLKIR